MKLKRQICLLLCILLVFSIFPIFSLSVSAGGGIDSIYWDQVKYIGEDLPRWKYDESKNTIYLYKGYEFEFFGEPIDIDVIVENGSKIDGGKFIGDVKNYGIVVGGDFSGCIYNYSDFACDTATNSVYNDENGVIRGGIYSGYCENDATIENGEFYGYVDNYGTVNGGKFVELYNEDDAVVNGGFVQLIVRMTDLAVSECSLEKISEKRYWAKIGSDFTLKVKSAGDFTNDFDYVFFGDSYDSYSDALSVKNGVITVRKGFKTSVSLSLVPHLRDDYKCTLKGAGTSASPYLISNADELDMARKLINYRYEEYADKCYKLTDDIVLNDGEFTLSSGLVARWKGSRIQASNMPKLCYPIGMAYFNPDSVFYAPFEGVFDGGGHSIKGFYIDESYVDSRGLFGETDGATIKNLNVENGFVNSPVPGWVVSGLLAGYPSNTKITNCTSDGIVYSYMNTGGLVGYSDADEITDCTNNAEIRIVSGGEYAGGIAGYSIGSKYVGCVNNGKITSVGNADYIGGITGELNSSEAVSCINNGAINVLPNEYDYSNWVGGIAGYVDYSSIILSKNNAGISAAEDVGGIAGGFICHSDGPDYAIALCQNNGKIAGYGCIGGIAGEMRADNDFCQHVEFCANRGDVTAEYNAGGIIGLYNNFYDSDGTGGIVSHNYSTGKIKGASKGGIIGCVAYPDYVVPTFFNYFTQSGIGGVGNTSTVAGCDHISDSDIKAKDFIETVNGGETFVYECDDFDFRYDEKNENDGYPVINFKEFTLPFTDVANPSWYFAGVKYAYRNGIMNGTSATLFSPNGNTSRAMLVTILYAMAGRPEVTYKNTFTDVPDGKWFTKAVIWASDNGVVGGMGGGIFSPDGDVTREQLAVILKAYWDYCGHSTEYPEDYVEIDEYPDYGDVHTWAQNALRWAVNFGFISGSRVGDNVYLQPRNPATRAQISIILKNYIENPPVIIS